MNETITLHPAERIRGLAVIPGDKSLSHRAFFLSALSNGRCRIENLARGEDIRTTIRVLRQLGVAITLSPDDESATVDGTSGKFTPPSEPLDCGNSASTMRLLAGILASQPFESVLIGDESLSRRSMEGLCIPLRMMGAQIESSENGMPPLKIRGGQLRGISHTPADPSAQVKSAMIMAALFATGETVIRESLQTRDHTERMLFKLKSQGIVAIDRLNKTVTVYGEKLPLPPFEIVIPGDASSAAYPIAAAVLLPESSITVPFVGLNPGRIAFFRHLQAMGAQLVMTPDTQASTASLGEPVGDIAAVSTGLRNVPIAPERIPAMIDELPLLAIIGCLADRDWEIRHADRLRAKETDRISTTVNLLRAIGAEVEEYEDGMGGPGNQTFTGGTVETSGDHRIAMTAAIAAWCSKSPVTINGADIVKISYPDFFEKMAQLIEYRQ